jgi:hypothetical protein
VDRVVRLVSAGIAVVALSACIGATPREDFDAEVQARGGGLTGGFVDTSLAAIASDFGATDWRELEVMFLSVMPGNRTVTAAVRDPRRSEFVDTLLVKDGEVLSTTPMQDADKLPLDDLVVLLGTVAIDPIEELTSAALDAFGEVDGFVERLTVSLVAGEPLIQVEVESARRTATVTFDATGDLVEVG